ncbi:MAG: hypothetical protein FJW39_10835 [Acidobacteria bacterium]|nr:hypothetical protein [Acidobacteriota bacterium]
MVSAVRSFLRVVLATLREIGDENAYQRHLTAHGLTHSAAEWRRFSEQRFRAKYMRAKCC